MKSSYPRLERIDSPEDLRRFPESELPAVASELRRFLIESVSQTGGHLASGLGAVELTLALHYVFDTPQDLIVWDVGHQCYPHKILTGRRHRFDTLRKFEGLSGFLKREESTYDTFNAGHASTSISAGLGMATAASLADEERRVVAVIGDGALTGGMAMEGLNNVGYLRRPMIVVLNDNEMSISPNVGAMQGYLNRIISGQPYKRFKKDVESILRQIPGVGNQMVRTAKRIEHSAKQLMVSGLLFEELGFRYVGPVNGHNLAQLIDHLKDHRDTTGPVLLHVVTTKGKGYRPAEGNPVLWHGASPFDAETGQAYPSAGGKPPSFTKIFGQTVAELAEKDERIVAITAAMPEGTGTDVFAKAHPNRFFDVGICEQHAVTFAAGLATQGLRPVVAIYSTFLQRAFDQIFHDVCLMNLPVVFALDRAGLVGADGPTHHGVFDFSYLRLLPNMTVMAPKDEDELRHMLATAFPIDGPVAIRYPRGSGFGVPAMGEPKPLVPGQAEVLRQGSDGTIWAAGIMATVAHRAAEKLSAEARLDLTVVNARFVKPIDRSALVETIQPGSCVLTVEENALAGGFGSAVMEAVVEAGIEDVRFERLGIPDRFQPHGSQEVLRARLDLDEEGIARRALAFFQQSSPKLKAVATDG
ncbi:MAG: 1-deoxy-D-xylulose-5-phosphate synthase [bacterium]|nr:1-deoxy-D-xylulose-5-phosphate synthase [bacterium]